MTIADATMLQALKCFHAFLHERSLRATSVRAAIVRAAMSRKGHFDIEELVADLRPRGVSKATVYRVLPLLMEAGLVQPTLLSGEGRRYETTFGQEHHDHLICSRCGEVVEFQFEAFAILEREVAAKHGYRLAAHFHELIGVCSACQAKHAAAGN